MNAFHLDAIKKSKNGCPQAILSKGFDIVQCPARLAEKYLSAGYSLSTRYAEGRGQTFYAVKDKNTIVFLSKLIKASISQENVFLEKTEIFDGIPIARTALSFKIYEFENRKIKSVHEIFGEPAEHIENYIFNMAIFGNIIGVPELPVMEGLF